MAPSRDEAEKAFEEFFHLYMRKNIQKPVDLF